MGCWNATCNVSNLPIFAGEKVVVIPLVRVMEHASACNCCYPTDNFVPFAFPIFGEYNDYGGIENATTLEENKKHLEKLEFVYENSDKEYVSFKKYDTLDDFINNIICCHEGARMKLDGISSLHPEGLADINFMMIHQDLYTMMVNEMFQRIPYDKKESYGNLLFKKFKRIMDKHRENCATFNKMLTEKPGDKKAASTVSLMKSFEVDMIMTEIFDRGIMLNTEKWKYFAQRMMDDKSIENDVLRTLVDQNMFTLALSALRKGYHCDSGCGSQSQETKMHVMLAKFILNHIEKQVERDRELNTDSQMSLDGEEETLFFFQD